MPFYKVPSPSARPVHSGDVTRQTTNIPEDSTGSDPVNNNGPAETDSLDGKTFFTEMTEVDRDAELMRRNMEHGLQIEEEPIAPVKQSGFSTKETRRQKVKTAIEQELAMQTQREQELAHMRQSFSPSGSTCSIDSAATGSSGGCSELGVYRNSTVTSEEASADDDQQRYAHPGESLIVREFREQKQRELELRGRWKEMGLDVPEGTKEGETPFTLPQPVRSSSNKPAQPGNKSRPDSASLKNLSDDQDNHSTYSNGSSDQHDAVTVEKNSTTKKVQPFEDPEFGENGKMPYVPADETPIEREIRLIKERELALRAERGMPLNNYTDETDYSIRASRSHDNSVDIGVLPEQGLTEFNRSDRLDPQVTGTLKKLANSRLQMEISKETQRELDLKTQGTIHTTSEERKGEPTKYVEIISQHNGFQ